MAKMERCENCKFCKTVSRDEKKYECHINPPVPVPSNGWVLGFFPTVKFYEWCGEYTPKKEGD